MPINVHAVPGHFMALAQLELSNCREMTMAGGWSLDGAGQDQISATVEEAVEQARRCLPVGESLTHCQECGEAITDAAARPSQGFASVSAANQSWKRGSQPSPPSIGGEAKAAS